MTIEGNIKKIIGEEIGNVIIKKLRMEIVDLEKIPEKTIYNMVYSLCNYVDSNNKISIYNVNFNEILNIWNAFLSEYKKNYNSFDYKETNKVIADYRINGIGYYWVDIKKLFCIDSMIRMKDCGRVNYGNTTFELRESTENESLSHVIIVFNLKDKLILQIKGKSSKLPEKKYWHLIYRFLLDFPEEINGYTPTFKPETDFKIQYLTLEEQKSIFLKHPKLIF